MCNVYSCNLSFHTGHVAHWTCIIDLFITGRGKCFKSLKTTFYFNLKKIISALSFVFSEKWHVSLLYSWYVLVFRTRFTFPLSWFWHFEYRNPSMYRCTSLTTLFPSWQNVQHLRLERRTSTCFSSIYVFSSQYTDSWYFYTLSRCKPLHWHN